MSTDVMQQLTELIARIGNLRNHAQSSNLTGLKDEGLKLITEGKAKLERGQAILTLVHLAEQYPIEFKVAVVGGFISQAQSQPQSPLDVFTLAEAAIMVRILRNLPQDNPNVQSELAAIVQLFLTIDACIDNVIAGDKMDARNVALRYRELGKRLETLFPTNMDISGRNLPLKIVRDHWINLLYPGDVPKEYAEEYRGYRDQVRACPENPVRNAVLKALEDGLKNAR